MQALAESTTKLPHIDAIDAPETAKSPGNTIHGADDLAHLLMLGPYGLSARDAVSFLFSVGFSQRGVIRSLKRARGVAPV